MNAGERLRVDHRALADRAVLELHGELDLAAVPLLESEIARVEGDAPAALVLDLADVEFIDSAGLRVLLHGQERAEHAGHRYAITAGSAQVQKLLAVAGMSDHFLTLDAPDAALPPQASGHTG